MRNPSLPMIPPDEARLERLWTVADHSDDPAAYWQLPRRVSLGGGEVYVLDAGARRVYVVSGTGEMLRTVGRAGPGPGELQRPFGVARMGDTLVVGDAGKGAIELFTTVGAPLGSVRLGTVSFWLSAWDDGRVAVSGLAAGGTAWLAHDLGGGAPRELRPAPAPAAEGAVADGCRRVSLAPPRILSLSCTVPAFVVADDAGRPEREVRIDRPVRELSAVELRTLEDRMGRDVSEVGLAPADAREMVRAMVEEHRVVRSMQRVVQDPVSGMFLMWEQDPEEIGGANPRLHVVSRSGVYLAAFSLPESWVDFDVRDSVVYALAVDEGSGLVRLVAKRIHLPEAALGAPAGSAMRR